MKTSLPSSRRPVICRASLAIAGVALGLAATPSLPARVINDFESGTFGPNASITGDASIVGPGFFSPASGSRQALLTTFSTAADGGNVSGIDAVTAAGVENSLNLSSGSLQANGASIGDASSLAFIGLTLNAGDVISFDYNFLTNATSADGQDFPFVTLQRGSAETSLRIFVNAAAASLASSSTYFNRETGLRTLYLDPVTVAGVYTLGFGVTDAVDDAVGSGLLIDNIQVNAVPEPSALVGIVCVTAFGVVRLLKRNRKSYAESNGG